MANGDPRPLLQIDPDELTERAARDGSPAPADATGTSPPEPTAFLQQETSEAERTAAREEFGEPDFDAPPDLTEEEEALLAGVAGETGFTPTIFERAPRRNPFSTAGATEGEGASADPTEQSGLTNEPSSISQIILHEAREGTGRTLTEEMIHSAQNRLGGDRVGQIIDSVAVERDRTAQPLREHAEINLDAPYSEQNIEQLADELGPSMRSVAGQAPVRDTFRTQVLRSMLREAGGGSLLEGIALEQQLNQ
jgi:hypothetical protein